MNAVLRKIVTLILIAGLLGVIVLGFFWLKVRLQPDLKPENAVPYDFALCLETGNFHRLSSALQNNSNIWKEFMGYELIEVLDSQLQVADSLARLSPEINRLLGTDIFISVHPDKGNFSPVFAMSSPDQNAREQILKLVSNETNITKESFENITIYSLGFKEGIPDSLFFYETRGIVVFSTSMVLLKRSVLNIIKEGSVFETGKYRQISPALGEDVEAHLYFNFAVLENLFAKLVIEEKVPGLSAFSSVAAMDLEINPDQLVLNGFSLPDDSLYQQLNLLSGQRPVPVELFSFTPSTLVSFEWLGISDKELFRSQLDKYFPLNDGKKTFREEFYKIFNGQAAKMILKESSTDYPQYLLLSLKSRGLADDYLKKNLFALKKSGKLIEETVSVNDNLETEIYNFPLEDFTGILFGDLLGDFRQRWFSFFGNTMVTANSKKDLTAFLYMNSLGQTVQNSDYYDELRENISSRSNFLFYVDPSQHLSEITQQLTPGFKSGVDQQSSSWRKLNSIGFQSTVTERMHYFRLFINYSGKIREFVNTVWERKLDAPSVIKPSVVLNHNNREKEIFIQDENHNIYLISNNGGIIWKQKTDGKILGEPIQIDYYRNQKLQYLFNTQESIHLVDRNGNNVEGFPVKLREKASTGLALFDYDNNGKLRIAVPTVNKSILMYDKKGKVVQGWNFKKSDHPINFPLKHIRLQGKDYLIAHDKFRLYLLDRKGRERVKPEKQIEFSDNNDVYYYAKDQKAARIIASDENGSVHEFYFNGKVRKTGDFKMSNRHYFLPEDLAGGKNPEMIFIDSSRLRVYNQGGKHLFSESFQGTVSEKPVVYQFALSDKKIGIVTGHNQKIYLINNDGSVYKGFPLKGSTLFSISSFPGLEDRFNLIVGNKDNFLYNYSVK